MCIQCWFMPDDRDGDVQSSPEPANAYATGTLCEATDVMKISTLARDSRWLFCDHSSGQLESCGAKDPCLGNPADSPLILPSPPSSGW